MIEMKSRSAKSKKEQALLLIRSEQWDAARVVLAEVVRSQTDDAGAWYMLAAVNHRVGLSDEAARCYQTVLTLDPNHAEAHYYLGNLYGSNDDHEQALRCYRRALELKPQYADAARNLGATLQKLLRSEEAIECYRLFLQHHPGSADIFFNLANALAAIGRHDDAVGYYRRALALKSDRSEICINLADTLEEQSKPDEAIACYQQALALTPNDGVKLRLAMTLPVIPASTADLRRWRNRFETEITRLNDEPLTLTEPAREITGTNFYLSYHGLNNRDLHVRVAALYQRACPALLWTAPHCSARPRHSPKVRVGFISRYLHHHSIGKTTRGILANLAREQFEVVSLCVPPAIDDEISQFIRAHSDRFVVLPQNLDAARHAIAALELDVLFYQDIGMEPFTYFLAFARLAPVQCMSFGHPDTTGIGNMDYFVSNDLFEPADASAHYSERLFLLRDLGTLAYYYRPRLPAAVKQRADFGLPADAHLYLCPQALFKLHPEFDAILGAILRADWHGRLVLLDGNIAHWGKLLRRRFEAGFPDAANRVVFLPPQKSQDFTNLIAISDVMLDTPHFNGMNTSLEAFAVGTPVVTLPTAFQRGRHTAGMYRKMGLPDCTAANAEDYVRIAVKLGTARDYRQHISDEILQRNHVLFEDIRVVREFERFFREAVAATNG